MVLSKASQSSPERPTGSKWAGEASVWSAKAKAASRVQLAHLYTLFKSHPTPAFDRLNRYLASVSGMDKLLMIIQYFSKIIVWYAMRTRNRTLAEGVRNVANPVGDFRILMRFTGLIPLVYYMRSIENSPPSTPRLHWLARLECWVNLVYYPLEHAYWLGAHHVLPWLSTPRMVNGLGMWSCRLWALYVVLHFFTLRDQRRQLIASKRAIYEDKSESSPTAMQAKLERWHTQHKQWWIELIINTAYFPLTVHWSYPASTFPDVGVGICGTIAALAQIYSGWQATS
ncbi:hypothetical protein H4R35_006050 [Dimargaris xerosporica]|nr:hypothetical protein H4R35_006050 [Dimargaris xerosporica]